MKTFINLSLTAMASLLILNSCFQVPEKKHTSYETVTLEPTSIEVPRNWSASLVGKSDVSITPQTSGQLIEVCVSEGEKVKKGQKLFVLDKRQPELIVNTAEANLLAAQAECNSAELEYESNRNLFEKDIVSSYMLKTSLNYFNQAKAAVEQAKAAVDRAKLELSYCTITSPVDGMVGAIPNNPGDQISQLTLLTTISGNTDMVAKFSVTETEIQELSSEVGGIETALKNIPDVTLFLKNGSEYKHRGRITSLSGVVDKYTGSAVCRATFPNPDGFLYSGIQGTVQMKIKHDGFIVIPLTSVVRLQDKTLVYKVTDKCAESVIVEIYDLGNGKDALLLSGLETGDTIVAVGAANVFDGQQVIFDEEDKD